MTAPTEAAIKVHDLSFRYGDNLVLDSVSLDIHQNDFLGLVGPNGGGKTTLVKLILGVLEPLTGSVKVLGQKPRKVHSKIGYVPQYARFDSDFPVTVEEMG